MVQQHSYLTCSVVKVVIYRKFVICVGLKLFPDIQVRLSWMLSQSDSNLKEEISVEICLLFCCDLIEESNLLVILLCVNLGFFHKSPPEDWLHQALI